MSAAMTAVRITLVACALPLPFIAAAAAQSPAEQTYDVVMNFGGLVAMVPKPTANDAAKWATATSLEEFWILAPRGDDRKELVNAAARARNGTRLPVREPNARHHAFLRVWISDFIRGGCAANAPPACEAAAEAAPETRLWIPLGAEDPFNPAVGKRARYDIMIDTNPSSDRGVTVFYGARPESLPAGKDSFAQACAGCASFQPGPGTAYAPPEPIGDFAVPLAFRAGFRAGEHVLVTHESVVVTRPGVSGATRIRLLPRQGAQKEQVIVLKPRAGSKLIVDIVNATGDEIAGAGLEQDELTRMEHFKLLYLLAPLPGGGFVYDYPYFHAPPESEFKAAAKAPAIGPNTDPFCTKPGQLKPRPK